MSSKSSPCHLKAIGTHRLTDDEREKLLQTIGKAVQGYQLTSACAYGSRVAGYAKPESDYDVIVVISKYPPRVRYIYIEGDLDVAALLVDEDALTSDAEKGALGEFVVGRLLNSYEVLDESALLSDVEAKFKRRVAAETLDEIISTYGQFSTALIIPIQYFLYEKLKKRATIYPPALYSYIKTYTCEQAGENLKATLHGFRRALSSLHDEGLISLNDGEVRIKKTTLRPSQLARLKAMATYTARGLIQYAVHGYAGRVGWNVVGKEVLSKIGRSRDAGKTPVELRQPKNLWRIDEGLLIAEGDEWLPQTAEHLGLGKDVKVNRRHLGEFYNITSEYILESGSQKVSLAVKKFKDPKSLKWAILNLWALPAKRFDMSPLARLLKEYTAIRTFREMGLNTPKIRAVALYDTTLVTDFIDGVDLAKIIADILQNQSEELSAIRLYGETLGRIHSQECTLGDTKPSNAIYFNSKIYLTDLEQADRGGDTSWDLAEFLYYSAKLTLNIDGVKRITQSFLDGYLKHGSANAVEKALNVKYLAPFRPLLAPTILKMMRKEMVSRAGVKKPDPSFAPSS